MAKLEEGMEVCESCEVHENLLKIVNEKMPEETELYDLAELFKVFGDSTRMRILFVLFEAPLLRTTRTGYAFWSNHRIP